MDKKIQEIKDQAFNLLSYRDRSCFELKDRLLKKGYCEDNINIVIIRLKELGYLNDEDFAFKWIKYRLKHKPRGKKLLRKELFVKGIDEELIDSALNSLIDDKLESKMGLSLAKKWLNSHQYDLTKLKRYLYNKGFTIDIIYKIIDGIKVRNV